MPRVVLFDVGLTLVHPDGALIVRELAERGVDGVDPEDAVAALQMSCDASHMRLPADTPDAERVGWAVAAALAIPPGAAVPAIRVCLTERDLYAVVDDDAPAVLAELRDVLGVDLGVVSNSGGLLTEELDRFALIDYFTHVVDSTVVGSWKPDPRIFLNACASMGVAAEDCWYVGDDVINDVIGGLAVGFGRVVLYDRLDLYPHIPGVSRIRRLAELPELLRRAQAERSA